jgi:hypothetical protein
LKTGYRPAERPRIKSRTRLRQSPRWRARTNIAVRPRICGTRSRRRRGNLW